MVQHMVGALFSDGIMHTFLDEQRYNIRQEIQEGGMDDLIREDPENAIQQLCEKYTLQTVSIDWEKKNPKQATKDDVMKVSFHVTFTGDSRLLRRQPTQFRLEVVAGTIVKPNQIIVEIVGRLGRDDFKRMLERWQKSVEFHLNNANKDADNFNRTLPATIKPLVDARAEQLRKGDDEMSNMGF